ncbi:hypothetical protein ACFL5Z_06725 [Planctomycetota bacterium]
MLHGSIAFCVMVGLMLGSIILFPTAAAEFSGMSYIDNGVIKIGINLDIGGAITYLSPSDSEENAINSHDWGRQIQMSFYSGPNPYQPEGTEVRESWKFLGWNPIQSGDCFGNGSKVIAYRNDGNSLYVKCIPMQWPMNNVPGKCTFEVWISLDGKIAKVRSKINNARDDHTQYAARGQELPAVYTNGAYYRLFTYTGDKPYTGGPLHQITKVWDTRKGVNVEGGPWDNWYATENWAALVREDDFGVGIWSPGSYRYTGGFAGNPGKGGPKDGPTGYYAPLRREILDHNIEYAYEYMLILGQLDEIRQFVYDNTPRKNVPSYRFDKNRQSWTLQNAHDAGWPINGVWSVSLDAKNTVLRGPDAFWNAVDMSEVHLRAAFDTGQDHAMLRWEEYNGKGGELRFPVKSDGKMRDYIIDLSQSVAYTGPCSRLLLCPVADGAQRRSIAVEYIGVKMD